MIRVLVVDNDMLSLRTVMRLFRQAGASPDGCSGVASAIELAMAVSPQLVVSDVDMPGGGGGWAVVRMLREAGHRCPMVLMSALVTQARKEEAEELGVPLVAKPIDARALMALVPATTTATTTAEPTKPATFTVPEGVEDEEAEQACDEECLSGLCEPGCTRLAHLCANCEKDTRLDGPDGHRCAPFDHSIVAGLESDIPLTLAVAAHAGTSHTPDVRGASEVLDYVTTMTSDLEALAKHVTTPQLGAILAEEFLKYRAGYCYMKIQLLKSKSRCMSTMIAGPANFPVRRQRKRSEIADRRSADLVAYRHHMLGVIARKLQPELRPIMTGDADAIDRLKKEIATATAEQDRMKAANAAIRKHARAGTTAQVAALVALGYSDTAADELLVPDELHRIGFPDYRIRNNGANIRRLQARLEEVSRAKAAPPETKQGPRGRIEDVPGEDRVRVFFPDKPDAATRARLKSAGYRWTPSLGCWQAYRNDKARAFAFEVVGLGHPERPDTTEVA